MVNWLKQITTPAMTTADIFAGDVLNWVVQYHSDVDLAAGDPSGIVKILTETVYNSGVLKFYDSNKSHKMAITTPDYSEDKTITFPTTWATSDEVVGRTTIMTLTGKVINSSSNTITVNATSGVITDDSTAIGDILASNGAKFIRKARGTSLQVLRTNTAGTDLEWASLDKENLGKSTASGNGSNAIFTIAHSLGVNPTYAWITCSSLTQPFTYTTSSTLITVQFATPPPNGSNNVVIYWRVVA